MDVKKTTGHVFQRLSLSPPYARRPPEEPTPIFDQLLREWRAGALRPVVSWPVDDAGKTRTGTGVGTDEGRLYPRNRIIEEHDREPVRHSAAHPDR
ncbi:hypothetical protein [Streptomyces chattanoogensis]|uniref:Uncharacterized protein n=1 Tax=Streptomyces chattanoogensis TaxID=66876 RepID=A0A0N0GX90_9ACTN|nr:hypothetical protein [Streptomyces chattanoogensis]KPC60849.1 hypothetical protein ADL29_27190 [Streptomyces chattanoogensis]